MNAPALDIPDVPADDLTRPRTRGECQGGPRPCPWVSCEHHLARASVERHAHTERVNESEDPWHIRRITDRRERALDLYVEELAARVEAGELPETCALDLADRGGMTLEEVGDVLECTRERIRQIEAKALKKLAKPARRRGLEDSSLDAPDGVDALRSLRDGRWMGEARPAEERRTVAAPPGVVGPSEVRSYDDAMWCTHLGTRMSAGLCGKRHTARERSSSGTEARPIYRGCAECPDGAALVERLGTAPREARRLMVLPVVAAANDTNTKEEMKSMEAETREAPEATREPTKEAAPSCVVKGCGLPRANAEDKDFAKLCAVHKTRASSWRTRERANGKNPSNREAVRVQVELGMAASGKTKKLCSKCGEHPAGNVQKNTRKGWEDWCSPCRIAERDRLRHANEAPAVHAPKPAPVAPAVAAWPDNLEALVTCALRLHSALGPDLARDLCALSPADRAVIATLTRALMARSTGA